MNTFSPTSTMYRATILHCDPALNPTRWRDPSIGRFTQADTFAGNIDDPITLNGYLYVDADPINAVDPSGHDSLSAAQLGRDVHAEIAKDFEDKLGQEVGISGPSIATILNKLGPISDFVGPITSRFPDLVDIKDKEVFEIKPAGLRQIATGLAQLIGYLYLFNKIDPTGGWHAGDAETYTAPPIITIEDPENVEDPIDVVAVSPPIAGVITYTSVTDFVEQRAKNVAETEEAELDDDLGIDTLDSLI
jgi:RHS repeat-associated protein